MKKRLSLRTIVISIIVLSLLILLTSTNIGFGYILAIILFASLLFTIIRITYLRQHFGRIIEEAQKKQTEYERILSISKVNFAIVYNDGKIGYSSKKFRAIVKKADIITRKHHNYFLTSSYKELIYKQKTKKQKKKIVVDEKSYTVTISPLGNSKKMVMTLQDITRSENLKRIKRNMAANVSHELNTPLTIINGFSDILLEQKLDKNSYSYVKTIKKNIQRLILIVKDLQLLSKLETTDDSEFSNIDFKKIAFSVAELLQPKALKSNVSIKLKSETTVNFDADPLKFEQMLFNLVENAIKATKNGVVSLCCQETDKNRVEIKVSDNGMGMESKYLDKIFERFFVVNKSKSRQSSGLGLSIVKRIVLLHKGKIWVKSEVDKGTTFSIILPKKQK